jgi:phosphatidylethanolamine/phosphatidyl-N-methylethanolamine N-methyltransferase
MAAELPDEYSVCVELGGGTGSLTSAILAAGVPSEKLIVVERDPRLAAHLRKRFPKVMVVEGDAQHLRRILADAGVDHVDAVISGLPLRNLPGAVRRNIAAEVFAALGLGGVFVQFTYWGEPPVPAEVARRFNVGSEMTRRVWRNMPPANVWRYERQANPD